MHDRGAPPAGYVRQAPDHRVTRNALAPAASTPPILTSNTARQHCTVCLNALTRHLQPQVIQARERAQIRAIKDSIGHVEVFQMDGVGTPIIGRPRPLPGHDTPNPAHNTYTLKCEEPLSPWEWSSRSEVASQSGSNDDSGDVMLVMEVSMRTTVTLDDNLLARAQELTGIRERSALIREAVELLVRIESGRQLAALGGSDPGAEAAPRSRARA